MPGVVSVGATVRRSPPRATGAGAEGDDATVDGALRATGAAGETGAGRGLARLDRAGWRTGAVFSDAPDSDGAATAGARRLGTDRLGTSRGSGTAPDVRSLASDSVAGTIGGSRNNMYSRAIGDAQPTDTTMPIAGSLTGCAVVTSMRVWNALRITEERVLKTEGRSSLFARTCTQPASSFGCNETGNDKRRGSPSPEFSVALPRPIARVSTQTSAPHNNPSQRAWTETRRPPGCREPLAEPRDTAHDNDVLPLPPTFNAPSKLPPLP